MSKQLIVECDFVDSFPAVPLEGVVYVSIKYATAMHRCLCGCGNQAITPFSPKGGWKLIYDGETVTLWPSVGNWSFPCQSHYWIVRNRIRWARRWSKEQIAAGRDLERRERDSG